MKIDVAPVSENSCVGLTTDIIIVCINLSIFHMAQATRTTARRARSADQAASLMEEKLTEALNAGKIPKLDPRKMEVKINLGPKKPIVLVKGDGTVTKEGKYVYQQMGVAAPTIYPYEQGLINGKWVKNFPGAASAKTFVVGRGGKPTAK